jgi:signal transduction histidine kinase
MRLSEFISKNMERILVEWEAFARTLGPAADTMDITALRDHAEQMLRAIVKDLNTYQSKAEQSDKSKGKADEDPSGGDSAASTHGELRALHGFSLVQMVSEYRALRASVLRLWAETAKNRDNLDPVDLTRFNEAIDQALAESVVDFSAEIDRSRDMLLGIVGHDLRNPLGAIIRSAADLVETEDPSSRYHRTASRILDAGRRMKSILSDLMDLTRGRLGEGIPITRADADLAKIGRQVTEEIAVMYPNRQLSCEASGPLRGHWDGGRIGQALSNLIANAAKHGAPDGPVTVTLRGEPEKVVLSVHNLGPEISKDRQAQIFLPLQRFGPDDPGPTGEHGLGLGLFIVSEIAKAHGGWTGVESTDEAGTTFTINLPREAPKRSPP